MGESVRGAPGSYGMAMEPERDVCADESAGVDCESTEAGEASWIMEDYKARLQGTGRRRNGDTICICAH